MTQELPSMVEDFEGRISHIVAVGRSESLLFVSPCGSEERKAKVASLMKELAIKLNAVKSSAIIPGHIYAALVQGVVERSWVIRRPTPTTFQIYLLDRGVQSEVTQNEVFELPDELKQFSVFYCLCPVLVSSVEYSEVFDALVDRDCRVRVESIGKSLVVMGYVKGTVEVKDGTEFVKLEEFIIRNASHGSQLLEGENGEVDSLESSDSVFKENAARDSSSTQESSEGSESSFRCSSTEQIGSPFKGINDRRYDGGGVCSFQRRITGNGHRNPGEPEKKKSGALFLQTAYKQFEPARMPYTMMVHFDKKDRHSATFWVINPKGLADIEQALRDGSAALNNCPGLPVYESVAKLRNTPCVVRVRANFPFKSLCRAVVAHCDPRTRRFAVLLVDFGWFKWVSEEDIVNVGVLDEMHPVRSLPIALIHCREDKDSQLFSKILVKGTPCEITIKNEEENVFRVTLKAVGIKSAKEQSLEKITEQGGGVAELINEGRGELEQFGAYKKLVSEMCYQQLKMSLMMETLSITKGDFGLQFPSGMSPGMFPGGFGVPAVPVMPVAMPMMVPFGVPAPSVLAQTSNLCVNQNEGVKLGTSDHGPSQRLDRSPQMSSFGEDGVFESERFRGTATRSMRGNRRFHEMAVDGGGDRVGHRRSTFGSEGGRAEASNCVESEDDGVPLWEKFAKKFSREYRRGGGRGRNNGSTSKMTSWEMAVAADRANRGVSTPVSARKSTSAGSDVFN